MLCKNIKDPTDGIRFMVKSVSQCLATDVAIIQNPTIPYNLVSRVSVILI